jgi:hypothetical protein
MTPQFGLGEFVMLIEDHMKGFLGVGFRFSGPSGIRWSFLNKNTYGDVVAQGKAFKDASNQMPKAINMQYCWFIDPIRAWLGASCSLLTFLAQLSLAFKQKSG